jgi:uncharacterized LabA/DUF88 family protein
MTDRVVIFIDGSNLFWACKGFRSDFRIDYGKLRDEIVGDRKLVRPYFYCGIGVPPTPEQIGFHDSLRFQGFTVVTRPLKVRQHGAVEKGVDVALVTDMLKFAFMNIYDVAILVSGDNDFAEAVKVVKDRGIRVEIVAFEHTIGRDLRMLADKFTSIDSIASKIEKK